jgi:hypothetical protein
LYENKTINNFAKLIKGISKNLSKPLKLKAQYDIIISEKKKRRYRNETTYPICRRKQIAKIKRTLRLP